MKHLQNVIIFCLFTSFSIQAQSFEQNNNFLKINIQAIAIDSQQSKIQITIINISKEIIAIYNAGKSINRSKYTDKSFVRLDLTTDFITDPLLFPEYKIPLIRLLPLSHFTFEIIHQNHPENIQKINASVEFITTEKIKNKRYQRKVNQLLKKKFSSLYLKDYFQLNEEEKCANQFSASFQL